MEIPAAVNLTCSTVQSRSLQTSIKRRLRTLRSCKRGSHGIEQLPLRQNISQLSTCPLAAMLLPQVRNRPATQRKTACQP